MLATVSDPQEITPPTPVRDRLGADSVPKIDAPLVTVWGSEGTSEVRAMMPLTTAEAAVVILEQGLECYYRNSGGPCGDDASGVVYGKECMI